MQAEYESAIDRTFRKRQESLRSLVQECYGRLLGDPVVAILVRSQLDTMQKCQSIEKIIKTLIDSENEVAVARLAYQLQQLRSNSKEPSEQDNSDKEEIEMLKQKLKSMEDEQLRQQSDIAALFASQGLQFVDNVKFSIQRLLKQYRLLASSVTARDQIIEKLYKQICEVRKELDSGRKSSQRQYIIHEKLEAMLHAADPTDQHTDCRKEIRQLHTEISRLRKVMKAMEESKNSVEIMSQKKLQDVEKNKLQQIRLAKQIEVHRTHELNTEIEVLKLQNEALIEEVDRARFDSERLQQEKHLLQLTVDHALRTKRSVQEKIEKFEGSLTQMKNQTDDLLVQNQNMKKQIIKLNEQVASLKQLQHAQRLILEKEQQAAKSQSELLSSYLQQINNLKNNSKFKSAVEDTKRSNIYIEEVQRTFRDKVQEYETKLEDKTVIAALLEEKIQREIDRSELLERQKYQLHKKLSKNEHILGETLNQLNMLKITLEFQRKIAQEQSRYRRKHMAETKVRRAGSILKDVNAETKYGIQQF